jgi:type III secretion system YscI/HrpB-like protein
MSAVLSVMAQLASGAEAEPGGPLSNSDTAGAAARLSDLLSAPDGTSVPGVDPVDGVSQSGPATLGDAILNKLNAVGEHYSKTVADAEQIVAMPSNKLGLSEVLQMQLSVSQLSLDVELISKGVSKAVQHVDTLTKLQ